MQRKLCVLPILAILLGVAAIPARSQVTHSAYEGRLPLQVGVGMSDFIVDFGHTRKELGISAWADWRFKGLPPALRGLGVEIEGHHIAYHKPQEFPQMQEDTGLGGVNYESLRWSRVHPYVKALAGFGSIDFPSSNPFYHHDTRTVFAFGGGADIPAWRSLEVRVDYEYQFWRQIFGPNDLNPNGVTVGVAYNFGRRVDALGHYGVSPSQQ